MTWFERGDGFSNPQHRACWVRVGPLVCEIHRWWLRFGVCLGRTYVGVYLGPFVVTLGRRHFSPAPDHRTARVTWEVTAVRPDGKPA